MYSNESKDSSEQRNTIGQHIAHSDSSAPKPQLNHAYKQSNQTKKVKYRQAKQGKKIRNHAPYTMQGEMQNMTTILTSEEKELLSRAANLMEELLETIEVSQDKTTAKELKKALREVEDGKARPIEELIRELGLEKDIPT